MELITKYIFEIYWIVKEEYDSEDIGIKFVGQNMKLEVGSSTI